jgi:hypothetical protein
MQFPQSFHITREVFVSSDVADRKPIDCVMSSMDVSDEKPAEFVRISLVILL